MVQVSSSLTLVDLTIRGLAPGEYEVTVRRTGDISQGVVTAGPIWNDPSQDSQRARGEFGTVSVGHDGNGSVFFDRPIQIWEMIGRSMVVTRQEEHGGLLTENDANTLVGVIARSAGVWENDKTVCSCSGKTIWEEREDEVQKGML